jgi:hypothetical protein
MKAKFIKETISFERGLEPKKALGIGTYDIDKMFPGFTEASEYYEDFDVIAYAEDTVYDDDGIFIMIIRFRELETKPNGMCVYDVYNREFIDEPASFEDYSTSFSKLTKKYNFTFI